MDSKDMPPISSAPVRDWASLPAEILGVIMDKLVDISDRVRTAATCKSWLSTFQDTNCNKEWLKSGASQLPMLLIPTEDRNETHRGLFSVIGSRALGTRLPVPYNIRCCGSSHGWLVFAEEDLSLMLFNPFSGETIRLPQVIPVPTKEEIGTSFYSHEYEIRKVVLSKDPSLNPDDYEVLALCRYPHKRRLALLKSGAKSWIYAEQGDYPSRVISTFQDITYFKGKFFAVSRRGGLVSLEPEGEAINLRIVARQKSCRYEMSYMIACGDFLMWISRCYVQSAYRGDDYMGDPNYGDGLGMESPTGYFEIDGDIYGYNSNIHHLTSSFKVHKFVVKEGKIEAVEKRHLGGHALFLGDNQACSVLASDFPGCRPDSIYYVDDWLARPFTPLGAIDIGVYSLEEERARPLYVPGKSQRHLPPPIWIVPKANCTNMELLSSD